ncbi:MAG: hypothetical protein IKW15_01445 [Bacteroidales bacterium]|nr:hypothetical protein [Bacteroidales bacterium]
MKARVKATGEIVDVLPYADEDGTVRFYANMENKWHEAYEIDIVSEVTQPDYWEKLHHQAAIAAMQGVLSNKELFNAITDGVWPPNRHAYIAARCDEYATALVKKLKNGKL